MDTFARTIEDVDGDALAGLVDEAPDGGFHTQLSGEFSIFGIIGITYELISAGKVQVCLTVAGTKVRCATVDWQTNPSVTWSWNQGLAKGHLTIALVDGRRLTYRGTVCVWFGSWHCKKVAGTIIEL